MIKIEIDNESYQGEVEIDYLYRPGEKASRYSPAEPAEIILVSVQPSGVAWFDAETEERLKSILENYYHQELKAKVTKDLTDDNVYSFQKIAADMRNIFGGL